MSPISIYWRASFLRSESLQYNNIKFFISFLFLIYKSRPIDFVKFFLYLRYIISNYNVSYLWKCTFNARHIRYLVLFHKTTFTKSCNEVLEKIKTLLKKLFLKTLWIQLGLRLVIKMLLKMPKWQLPSNVFAVCFRPTFETHSTEKPLRR